jgi:hypothetical protein
MTQPARTFEVFTSSGDTVYRYVLIDQNGHAHETERWQKSDADAEADARNVATSWGFARKCGFEVLLVYPAPQRAHRRGHSYP